jgi:hypothetical protein
MRSTILFVLLAIHGAAALARGQAPQAEFREAEDLAELEAQDIAPDLEGVRLFFDPPGPSEEDVKLARLWTAQLGSEKYEVREAASAKLLEMRLDALEAVERAAESEDAETRTRARALLARLTRMKEKRDAVLPAVLRTIVRNELKGLTRQLLKIAPEVAGEAAQENLRRALWTTVRADDAPLLRNAIADGRALVKQAAILALPAAVGEEAREELLSLLSNDDAVVRLAAAQAAAPLARQEGLSALIGALEAEDLEVRMEAIRILAALTGERLGYAAYVSPDRRAPAVERWKAWLAENAEAPLRQPLAERPLPMGRLLVCHFEPFGVTELDESGKSRLALTAEKIAAPCGCAITSEGWRVIGDWGANAIIAFDGRGAEIWRVSLPGMPNSLQQTPDGGWLTGLFDEKEIRRMKQDGETLWKATVAGKPSDVQLLPNGNVLACLYTSRQVVELDREGKVVWQIESVPPPESARRLASGNTLVTSSLSKVLEYAPDGEVVWEYTTDIPLAYDAIELPSGNILIGFRRGLREVHRAGHIVRPLPPQATVRRICVY